MTLIGHEEPVELYEANPGGGSHAEGPFLLVPAEPQSTRYFAAIVLLGTREIANPFAGSA